MKEIILIIILVVLVVAWYLFRPERLFIDSTVDEGFPEVTEVGNPKIISEGSFKPVAHDAEGIVTIYDIGDDNRVMRFTDFAVSNGPDVHVYLVAADDPMDSEAVKSSEIYELGPIKGNVGNQNYDLGPDVNLDKFKSVVIWCKRFGVNFAVAGLEPN